MNETLVLPAALPCRAGGPATDRRAAARRPDGKLDQLETRFTALDAALERQERELRGELGRLRGEAQEIARGDRAEQAQALERFGQGLAGQVGQLGTLQAQQFEAFGQHLNRLTQSFDARVEQLRLTVETRLGAIQTENAAKLEEMRKTVDESCTPRSSSVSANPSSSFPSGWNRCIAASAKCRRWPPASATSRRC